MTPVIPSSVNNVALVPQPAFIKRINCLAQSRLLGKSINQTCFSHRYILPLSTSVRLFPQVQFNRKSKFVVLSATGTDIAVEEANASIAQEGGAVDSDVPSTAAETSEQPALKSTGIPDAARTKRPLRAAWKSEMPPVKNEELIAGATFTGKVKSIQPFGAFIDFGAFTDGLVHVSQLSDSFVKDVGSIVSVGQEVKVILVEANVETRRISLSMREYDDVGRPQQQNDGPPRSDKGRPPRRDPSKSNNKKTTKLVKGQDLEGTVKNFVRAGAFISLPDGEDGFLPKTEEADEGFGSLMGETTLQVGQEVSVRVLRIARGQATLTMKKEEANALLDAQLNQGVIYTATNPFALAFRRNKYIAAFLDEKEAKKAALDPVIPEATEEITEEVKQVDAGSSTSDLVDIVKDIETSTSDEDVGVNNVANAVKESDSLEISSDNLSSVEDKEGQIAETVATSEVDSEVPSADTITSSAPAEEEKVESNPEENGDITSSVEEPDVPSPKESTAEESQVDAEVVENQVDDNIVKDEVQIETPATDDDDLHAIPPGNEKPASVPEGNGSVANSNKQNETPSNESVTTANISPALVKQLREETGAGMMDCKNALSESGGDIAQAQEFLRKKGLASADKKSSRATAEGRIGSYIHDSRIGILIEVNCETDFVSRGDIFKELVDDLAMQTAAYPQVQYLATEDIPEEIVNKERDDEMQKEDLLSKPEQIRSKIVDGRIRKRLEDLALLEQPYIKNDKVAVKDWVKQTIATIGENIKLKRFVRYNLGEGLEKKSQDFAAEVAAQTAAKAVSAPVKEQPVAVEATKETVEKEPAVQVSAALVKQLRDESGAGMMDCKKALVETGGEIEKAQEYLRRKGLSSADKKSSRITAEGRIGSYIHDARIGVLIEVNCETDFVGRSEKFKELVDDLAMQVVASPQVKFVSIEDIPESYIRHEKEMEMQREDLLSKPENIREKIVDGRISKRLGELVLLEQPFIKDDSVLVKDLVKQTIAALGENIKARRFVRFILGEN